MINHTIQPENVKRFVNLKPSHFGIVADYKEVVPALTAKLKELKSK